MSLKYLIAEISFEIGPVPREKLRLHYRPSQVNSLSLAGGEPGVEVWAQHRASDCYH